MKALSLEVWGMGRSQVLSDIYIFLFQDKIILKVLNQEEELGMKMDGAMSQKGVKGDGVKNTGGGAHGASL